MNVSDTIFAVSSGHLPSGVAVVRLSGAGSSSTLQALLGRLPRARSAAYGKFLDEAGEVIDAGIALFFPAPASFTGEDVVELHLHGGRAVVARMLAVLGARSSLRSAEQGEFTRRAFLNGKLDLTDAEALADLIEAETEAQRRFAMQNAEGGQRALYENWRRRLIGCRAMLEANLDFSDQDDVPDTVSDAVARDLADLEGAIEEHIASFHRAEILRDGYDVVIIGPPNAGKSSLLNAIAKREAALVSDEAGTTRDLIEVSLDLGGLKVRLTDTAGIREGAGKVEAMGIERARSRARAADLVLQLHDLTASDAFDVMENAVVVGTKVDLAFSELREGMCVSSATGEGISALLELLQDRAKESAGSVGDLLPARSRHVELLKRAVSAIQDCRRGFGGQLELQAEALRCASDDIGRITGRVDVEEVLDVIFGRFCIGK